MASRFIKIMNRGGVRAISNMYIKFKLNVWLRFRQIQMNNGSDVPERWKRGNQGTSPELSN
eukprot:10559675-Heterocapsa_arctica.AAC.1